MDHVIYPGAKRWIIPISGTLLQTCLGTVYAWSYFQKPIMKEFGWSNGQTMWIFSIAICFLGLSAAWGGVKLPRYGPKKLAMIGGLLYGIGWMLGSLAMSLRSLPLFYLGFGVVGGCGLGLGYVTPVATAAKWFPDKKGLVTGMVVMGFGLGALFMSKLLAPALMSLTGDNLYITFMAIGAMMLVLAPGAGWLMKNPPAGYSPLGLAPSKDPAPHAKGSGHSAVLPNDDLTIWQALVSKNFLVLWIVFFANICAGMMFIGLQSPMLQDILKLGGSTLDAAGLASAGALLIAGSSLFNGLGRIVWGSISDRIGRVPTFRLILGTQVLAFVALLFTGSPVIFCALVCYVLLCYGGGFGTMPATILTLFGVRLMPVVYGCMLTAWSMGGIVGPQLAALIKDRFGLAAPRYTFTTGAIILLAGFALTLFLGDRIMTKKNDRIPVES